VACLLLGCNRTTPEAPPGAPAPVANKKEIDEAVKKGSGDIGKQIENAERALEELAISFLIDGVRDEKHNGELFHKVQGLRDTGAKNSSVNHGGAYGKDDRYFRISPISDIEAAAAKIDFGRVVAVDAVDRVIVLDASAKSAPRPGKGWPGAKAVDQYVIRKIATRFERPDPDLVKTFGRDKVVVVCVPSIVDLKLRVLQVNLPIIQKLEKLGPVSTSQGYPGTYGPQQHSYNISTLAPIAKLSDVVKALDGVANLAVDDERRVVIVDLLTLKPRPAKVKEQPSAPTK